MKRGDFAWAPQQPNVRGLYLYAMQLPDGVVKFGCSRNPRMRFECLYDDMRRKFGMVPAAVHLAAHGVKRGFAAERALIEAARKVGATARGREWFHGIAWDAACALVDRATQQAEAA